MTQVNDLLKPRIKVTTDWPFNDRFEVGSILTFFKAVDDKGAVFFYHHGKTHQNFEYGFFKRYPNNFKEMEWWEDREPGEMPEYIRRVRLQGNSDGTIKIGQVVYVTKWAHEYFNEREYPELKVMCFYNAEGQVNYDENCFQPATEQEYIQSN